MSDIHTEGGRMAKTKIAIALDPEVLEKLDALVDEAGFPSRSQAVETAIQEKLDRIARIRLARESAKLDPTFEKALAEEGLGSDAEWPEY
jgi:Arc/MetJ-type ribon-helix-helix transcriptional regulator